MKLAFEEFKIKVEIVPQKDANQYRTEYIKKFININSDHYKKYIETIRQFSDGMCYTGYLWDCLISAKCISFKEFDSYRSEIKEVMVFWDIHSMERIWIPEYWKFGKDTVQKLTFEDLMDNLEYMPEDIYIFDESLQWTLILTHEDIDGKRICEKSGNV